MTLDDSNSPGATEQRSDDKPPIAATGALAQSLLSLFSGRQSAYARRHGKDYFTARTDGNDCALTPADVENHLNGTQPIGIYLVDQGSDQCRFGIFDIDDHEGRAGWEPVCAVAKHIQTSLTACGLRFVSFRSGGGKGIHIALPFASPVKAAVLRKLMKQLLKSLALKDGSRGVEAKEVEVFPKQDKVAVGSYGSLVAVPLARQSVLLDKDFSPSTAAPLAILQGLKPNESSALDQAGKYIRKTKPDQKEIKTSPASTRPSGEAVSHPLSACLFIQHCETNAARLKEPLWYAAACNLTRTENGGDYFDQISALDVARYDEDQTHSKFMHAGDSVAPHTCAKISELGFTCPNMKPDGQCSVTGGRHPVSFAMTIPQLVSALRVVKPVPVKHRKIADLVLDSLKVEGTFYAAKDDKSLHYFYNIEKKLCAIDGSDFRALCCELFGMNAAEPEYKFVLSALETYANRYGTVVEFFRFARFTSGVLYINAGKNQVFRLDGKAVKTVDNGTDGILFRNSAEVEPIEAAATYTGSPVKEYLVSTLNCDSQPLHDLYWVFIYALFFESLLPTKPIVLISGEKGSGKSFTGRALKQALFGRESNVDTGLTSDEKNAKAAFANNYFLCMDNVDGKITWMANLLASVSTGTLIKERKLYENNVEVVFTPRCFVMINSREPTSLKRDDVVDRLLIFPVERYAEFVPDAQLLERISSNRSVIWAELLANLNRIVKRLKTGVPLVMKDQRLADFANVGLLIGKVIRASSARQAFSKLEESRNALVLEDHPLLAALNQYITRHPKPEWVATGKLFQEVRDHNYSYPVKSAQYFGQQLKGLSSNLRSYLDIQFRTGAHNVREVRIGALGQFSKPKPNSEKPKKLGTTVTTKSKVNNFIDER